MMRISTSTIFDTGGNQISNLTSAVYTTQEQISSGKAILTPADNPVAAAQALVISQSAAINDQYATNRTNATNTLNLTLSTLSSVTNLLQSVKSSLIQAGGGALNDTDRATIATSLGQDLQQMLGYANATDGTGSYLFSGFSTSTTPYSLTQNGATYQGDQGQQSLQVATSTQIPISASGPQIFGNIRTSAGQLNVVANSANAGQGAVTASSITNPAAFTGDTYNIVFSGPTTYNVIDKTTGQAVGAANQTYTSGTPITFGGMSVTITNSATPPANGDQFTVQPGNQNIFETITDAINLLNTPTTSPAAKANLTAGLNQANNNIDSALNNVLNVSTTMGSNVQQLNALNNQGSSQGVVYSQTLSGLQDLDYAKAVTQLSQQQTTLQAAQMSFIKISGLSLFNYLNG
jgi:flagellar hook-associated protein 3 FlgL